MGMSNDSSDDGEWFPVMVRKRCFEALFLKLVFWTLFPFCCTSVCTPEGVALVWCAYFVRPADFADPLVARGNRGDGGLPGRTLTIEFLGRVGTLQNKNKLQIYQLFKKHDTHSASFQTIMRLPG